jgi:DNA-binding NarL/FixJ family response regulator
MDSINVFLSDWQVLFREGIHFTLSGEEDINVIGEATSSEEAMEFITGNAPHIAILNSNHSEFNGISLTRLIRRNMPKTSVILISDTGDTETYIAALKCGASACITKNIDPEEIVRLTRRIAGGASPISELLSGQDVARGVLEEFKKFDNLNKEMDGLLASLSEAEKEILKKLSDGSSIQQISSESGTGDEAIRHHLDNIVAKLVKNTHDRELIETAQAKVTALLTRAVKRGKNEPEYISREEFETFKESIRSQFRTFLSGME